MSKKNKSVMVKFTMVLPVEVPEDYTNEDTEFFFEESSHCFCPENFFITMKDAARLEYNKQNNTNHEKYDDQLMSCMCPIGSFQAKVVYIYGKYERERHTK